MKTTKDRMWKVTAFIKYTSADPFASELSIQKEVDFASILSTIENVRVAYELQSGINRNEIVIKLKDEETKIIECGKKIAHYNGQGFLNLLGYFFGWGARSSKDGFKAFKRGLKEGGGKVVGENPFVYFLSNVIPAIFSLGFEDEEFSIISSEKLAARRRC